MSRHAWIAPEWQEPLAAAGLTNLAPLVADDGTPRLSGDWLALSKPGLRGRQRWRWNLGPPIGRILYVKRYFSTPLHEQLDRIRRQHIRHGRAWWEYQISQQLAEAQIPAVRVIGVIEEMRGALERRSAVLFEQVAGEPFDRAWERLVCGAAPVTRGRPRFALTIRLARLICAFHQTGYCHRDLYLCHVFAEIDPRGVEPQRFALIDLARAHRPLLRRARWLLKDLSQLDASARQIGASCTDRVRFLIAYLGLEPGAARTRWYARRIVCRSNRILRRIERRSRRASAAANRSDPS